MNGEDLNAGDGVHDFMDLGGGRMADLGRLRPILGSLVGAWLAANPAAAALMRRRPGVHLRPLDNGNVEVYVAASDEHGEPEIKLGAFDPSLLVVS